MYEFFDAHGERVTVRSARTLGRLLGSGQIIAATRFRRADEAEFEPAGTHAELCGIAAQFGISLGEPSGADIVPSPGSPPPPPPESNAAMAASEQPSTPLPGAFPGPLPGPRTGARSAPLARGPWSALAHPHPPLRAPALPSQQHSPQPTRKPPQELGPLNREGSLRRIGLVLAYCFAAAFGGLAVGALAAMVLQGTMLSVLAIGLGSGASAWVADRSLAARRPAITQAEIAVGLVIFAATCLVSTRGSGLVVALPICAVLWAKLRARTAEPTRHRRP